MAKETIYVVVSYNFTSTGYKAGPVGASRTKKGADEIAKKEQETKGLETRIFVTELVR